MRRAARLLTDALPASRGVAVPAAASRALPVVGARLEAAVRADIAPQALGLPPGERPDQVVAGAFARIAALGAGREQRLERQQRGPVAQDGLGPFDRGVQPVAR